MKDNSSNASDMVSSVLMMKEKQNSTFSTSLSAKVSKVSGSEEEKKYETNRRRNPCAVGAVLFVLSVGENEDLGMSGHLPLLHRSFWLCNQECRFTRFYSKQPKELRTPTRQSYGWNIIQVGRHFGLCVQAQLLLRTRQNKDSSTQKAASSSSCNLLPRKQRIRFHRLRMQFCLSLALRLHLVYHTTL